MAMSGTDIALIISAVGTLITVLTSSAALFIGMFNKKAIAQTAVTVDQVHMQTDGLTKALVVAAKIEGEAIGKAKGVAQEEIRAGALKEGQSQAATEAARIQTEAAQVQAKAATIQTAAATIQSEAAKKKVDEDGKKY